MKKLGFNQNKKTDLILKCLIVGLFPFLTSLLFCKIRGFSFFDLYLPSSYNNDVLYYYKQVEGVVKYGCPMGYFVPQGMGINMCSNAYILDNFYDLNSRYITTNIGSEVEEKSIYSGYEVVASSKNTNIYKRY